jgi:hypothetical protein
MKKFKKLIALATLFAMFGSAADINAQDYYSNVGGIGYEESRQAHSIAPAIALGTIAAVAIIAIAVQNRSHSGHGHSH